MSAVESTRPLDPDIQDPDIPAAPAAVLETGIEPPRRGPVRALIALTRPRHWTKNILVIALPCLTESRWDLTALREIGPAIGLFIVASVCVYIINDLVDRERDRLHPVKRHRPLAAGELRAGGMWVLVGLLLAGLAAAVLLDSPEHLWPVPAYLLLNVAYTFRLKHLPIVDVFTVAIGFVLRALQGYLALRVTPSSWLLMCVFTLCLLLILGKRRREMVESSGAHRPALAGYSAQLLDYMLVVTATLSVVVYTIHLFVPLSAASATALILVTVPCAIFALFRYLQVVLVFKGGSDPVRLLLHDRVLIGVGLLWAVLVAVMPLPSAG